MCPYYVHLLDLDQYVIIFAHVMFMPILVSCLLLRNFISILKLIFICFPFSLDALPDIVVFGWTQFDFLRMKVFLIL